MDSQDTRHIRWVFLLVGLALFALLPEKNRENTEIAGLILPTQTEVSSPSTQQIHAAGLPSLLDEVPEDTDFDGLQGLLEGRTGPPAPFPDVEEDAPTIGLRF